MSAWEVVIGLETHVQLATRSKIFSGASTAFGAPPNTQASPVDLALPGVLPVMNAAALEYAVRFGLAVGAQVAPRSVFARKNYFYPDLPKGYQISQYEIPVVAGGGLPIVWESGGARHEKTVRLTRAHLEEDAGKSLHEDAMRALGGAALGGMSGIDLNRAGTPLLEVVTEPDMRSSRRGRRLRAGAARPGDLAGHLRRQHAGGVVPLSTPTCRSARVGQPSTARAARSRT